ncbi:MAG: hypothetical protein AAB553_01810 [Patescibacteria group bacterium]
MSNENTLDLHRRRADTMEIRRPTDVSQADTVPLPIPRSKKKNIFGRHPRLTQPRFRRTRNTVAVGAAVVTGIAAGMHIQQEPKIPAPAYEAISPNEKPTTDDILQEYLTSSSTQITELFAHASLETPLKGNMSELGQVLVEPKKPWLLRVGDNGFMAAIEGGNHEILLTKKGVNGVIYTISAKVDDRWWNENASRYLPDGILPAEKIDSISVSWSTNPEAAIGGHLIMGLPDVFSIGVQKEDDGYTIRTVIGAEFPERSKRYRTSASVSNSQDPILNQQGVRDVTNFAQERINDAIQVEQLVSNP